MATDVLSHYITSDVNVCGGKPCIAGRRIRVMDIAIWHEKFGWSADTIASKYDLTLAEVHAALAHYYDHRESIEADIKADAAFVAELKRRFPSKIPAKTYV